MSVIDYDGKNIYNSFNLEKDGIYLQEKFDEYFIPNRNDI